MEEIEFSFGSTIGLYGKKIEKAITYDQTIAEHICLTQNAGDDLYDENLWLFSRFDDSQRRYSVGFFMDSDGHLKPSSKPAFCFFPKENGQTGDDFDDIYGDDFSDESDHGKVTTGTTFGSTSRTAINTRTKEVLRDIVRRTKESHTADTSNSTSGDSDDFDQDELMPSTVDYQQRIPDRAYHLR